MNKLTTNFLHSEQTTQFVEVLPTPQPLIESPASWMKDGDSPGEIILALAFLVGALTRLLQVLIIARHKPSHDKTE